MTTTTEMLARLPELAAEAFLTWNHPNPSGEVERRAVLVDAPPPTDIAVLDALRVEAELDSLTELSECVRVVWEQMPEDERGKYPDPRDRPTPTWAGESDWLRVTHGWWVANLDDCDLGWVEDVIRTLHTNLERVTRTPKPIPLRCPDCQAAMRVQAGGQWTMCDEGHQHAGPNTIAVEWRHRAPMGTTALSEALGIPVGTIWTWKRRGRITPQWTHAGNDYWLPWDVLRVAYPDLSDMEDGGLPAAT